MKLDNLISEVVGSDSRYNDHFGVEIEVELKSPWCDEKVAGWNQVEDGSLKHNGKEFVFSKPVEFKEALVNINTLFATIKKTNNAILDTGRAGVHVHVNIGDLTVKQFTNFMCLCVTYEKLLANYCGELRTGNLFCLTTDEAEYPLEVLYDALKNDRFGRLHTDDIRYAFINLKAVPQYGSIEFRGMRSDGDEAALAGWLTILSSLKAKARKFDNPIQVLEQVSALTPANFVKQDFGDAYELLKFYDGWEDDMMDSIRRIQRVAYSLHW